MDHQPAVVRLATAGEAAAVHRVLLAAFDPLRDQYTVAGFEATVLDPARVAGRMSAGPIWLAIAAGTPVGTFGTRDDSRGHYLRGMAVVPEARGQGVGGALLAEVLRHVDSHPAPRTWLYTTPFLEAATALYLGAGFVRFDEDPPANLYGTPLIGMQRSVDRETTGHY